MNIIQQKSSFGYFKRLPFLVLFFAISMSLFCGDIFIHRSTAAFLGYMAAVSMVSILSSLVIAKSKYRFTCLPLPICIALALAVYVVIQSYILNEFSVSYSFYIIGNSCFLFSLYVILKRGFLNPYSVFKLVALGSVIESTLCILQYLNIVRSFNPFFHVTGSWENPNVTAMFIAIALPAVWSMKGDPNVWIKKARLVISSLLICALLLLECRTALISSIIGISYLLQKEYDLLRLIKQKKHRLITITAMVFSFAIMAVLLDFTYRVKKDSADGRKLIWKISACMVLNEPIMGYGYGAFERNYNLSQSRYFSDGGGSVTEIRNAGFVKMAYNELLQNLVEGGIIGTILVICLVLSLLFPIMNDASNANDKKTYSTQHTAYCGILMFAVMSLVNFTIQAIPVMCVFVIYAAISSLSHQGMAFTLAGNSKSVKEKIPNVVIQKWLPFRSACFLLFGFAGLALTIFLTHDELLIKESSTQTRNARYDQSLLLLSSVSYFSYGNDDYQTTYGNTLYRQRNYFAALQRFKHAELLTSNPLIFIKMALCEEKTGDYKNAVNDITIAEGIEPGFLAPKASKMNWYMKIKDTIDAVKEAKIISKLIPKVSSTDADRYKEAAKSLLVRLNIESNSLSNIN